MNVNMKEVPFTDHTFAAWLRAHGWEGDYANPNSTKATTYFSPDGKVLACTLMDNATCKVKFFIPEAYDV